MFVQRLKELRARDYLTQADLAKLLQVSPGTVGMWETGERNPDREMLVKIADCFKVSLDYLVGRDVADNLIDLLDVTDREKVLEYARLLLQSKKNPGIDRDGSSGLTDSDKNGNKIQFKKDKKRKRGSA